MSNSPEQIQDDQEDWRVIHEPNVAASSPEMFIDPRLLAVDRSPDAATTTVIMTDQPTPDLNNYLHEPLSALQSHATDHEAVVIASNATPNDTGSETLLWQQHLTSTSRDSAFPESG